MEIKSAARRPRHFLARFFFVAVVFAVVWITRLSAQPFFKPYDAELTVSELVKIGQAIFAAFSLAQMIMVAFLAPLYSAGAIAADRQRNVFELVLMTRLSNFELIAGKFLVRVFHLVLIVLSGVPVMFACTMLGGVGFEQILTSAALTLVVLLFTSSLGLFVSIVCRRVATAAVATYGILILAWVAALFVGAALIGEPGFRGTVGLCLVGLNPVFVLAFAVIPGAPGGFGLGLNPEWVCAGFYGIAAVVLMTVNVLTVRRLGLWASRERVRKRAGQEKVGRARRVWANPVAWREVRTAAVHRRLRWARSLALIFCIVVSSPLWAQWLGDWLEGRPAIALEGNQLAAVVSMMATLAWLLIAVLGGVSFSHEQEHQTLDALLTTPLSARAIVLGKLAGTLRATAFALALPVGFAAASYSINHGVSSNTPEGIALAAVILMSTAFLIASFALACSVQFGQSGRAMAGAVLATLTLSVVIPLMSNLVPAASWRDWVGQLMVSPTYNVYWALQADVQIPTGMFSYYPPSWSERLGTSLLQVLAQLAVAVGLLRRSVRHVETRLRASPRSTAGIVHRHGESS